jgi:choline dehydrogenase
MDYDYIVVGGGSSGCLVGGRLAMDHSARVLVIEAGPPDSNPMIRMPAGFVKLLNGEDQMWLYRSVAQEQLGGRTPIIPQGRVLGGGSSVNAMVYIRGQAGDYEDWREATGDAGWGYEALLRRFVAMEGNERLNNAYHGVAGPWKVSDLRHVCELSRAFVQAAQGIGLPFTDDFNGASQRGAGFYQVTMKDGRRWSSVDAFLRPARATGRLEVKTGCLVERVLVEGGRARGVVYRDGGKSHTARCEGEVLMAAGAIGTPKILMLSGIGPADHLRAHGISPIADLPGVGGNFHDHTEVPVVALCNGPYGYFGQDRGLNQIRNGLQYLGFRSGPVVSNGVEAGAFYDPDDLSGNPKLQQFCVPSVFVDKDLSGIAPSHGITINSCVARPASRGRVSLASGDPADMPLVDPNYLAEPEDLRLALAGLRRARDILREAPLAGMIDREIFPGPAVTGTAELEGHARRFVKTVYHPVGTCAMGRESDTAAVLSPDLRVRGVAGLRVIDASAMPNIVSGNTHAAVLVLADRAVDLIAGHMAGGSVRPTPAFATA